MLETKAPTLKGIWTPSEVGEELLEGREAMNVVDLSDYGGQSLDTAKWKALNCHRTQFGSDNLFRRMPEDMALELMGRETFALATPFTSAGTRLSGLFDGI